MAQKQPLIVIKKINIVAGGAHGGAWKVAFADFMTAMMAFFLVMWLLAQSEETKKNVSEYFSTPSIIEYSFSNYGVELTLEKLFLDLINEPLKFFAGFVTPIDHTPDIMSMGTKKIVLHHIAEQLGELAEDVDINQDSITFEIPDSVLFKRGTADPSANYVSVMDKVKNLTTGLEDSTVYIDSIVSPNLLPNLDRSSIRGLAEARLDLVSLKVKRSLESETVDILGKIDVSGYKPKTAKSKDRSGARKDASKREAKSENNILLEDAGSPTGAIRFSIRQKDLKADGSKPRPISEDVFGKSEQDMSVYDNFVDQLTRRKTKQTRQ